MYSLISCPLGALTKTTLFLIIKGTNLEEKRVDYVHIEIGGQLLKCD